MAINTFQHLVTLLAIVTTLVLGTWRYVIWRGLSDFTWPAELSGADQTPYQIEAHTRVPIWLHGILTLAMMLPLTSHVKLGGIAPVLVMCCLYYFIVQALLIRRCRALMALRPDYARTPIFPNLYGS